MAVQEHEAEEAPSWQFATGQWLAERLRGEDEDASPFKPRLSPEDVQALERVAKRGSRHVYFSNVLEARFRSEQRQDNRLPRLVICAMAVIFYASAPLWAGRVFDLPAATDVLATRLCLGVVAPVHLLAAIAEYFWVASGLAETLLLAAFIVQIAFIELMRVHASMLGLHLGPMLTASVPISVFSMINLSLSRRVALLLGYVAVLVAGFHLYPDPRTHLATGEWFGAVLLVSLSLTGSMFFRVSVRRGWAANNLLEVSATQDVLTGLPNRLAFSSHVEAYLRSAKRYDKLCMLALVDLDHFKKINDRYGHDYGDGVLMEVGLCLNHFARRAGDLVARVGGEEFAIFLYDCNWQGAKRRLDDLTDSICDLGIDHEDNAGGIVTASVGAVVLSPSVPLSQAYQAADKLLYQAKAQGRNRAVFEIQLH